MERLATWKSNWIAKVLWLQILNNKYMKVRICYNYIYVIKCREQLYASSYLNSIAKVSWLQIPVCNNMQRQQTILLTKCMEDEQLHWNQCPKFERNMQQEVNSGTFRPVSKWICNKFKVYIISTKVKMWTAVQYSRFSVLECILTSFTKRNCQNTNE